MRYTPDRIARMSEGRWGQRTLESRFWSKVRKTDGCWEWTGATRNGYAHFTPRGNTYGPVYGHRLSWEMANGPIPAGMEICHSCDNPPCVRPDHLFLGSRATNAADMSSKGRAGATLHRETLPRGEAWHRAHPPKAACKYGHPYPESRHPKYGGCAVCRARLAREHMRRYHARKKAARA